MHGWLGGDGESCVLVFGVGVVVCSGVRVWAYEFSTSWLPIGPTRP